MIPHAGKQYKGKKPVFFIFILLGLFGTSAAVMYLWNAILPGVTGLKTITYWQAMGIFVLSRLLFGNFGFGGKPKRPDFDSARFKEKLMDMNEGEKDRFKEEWNKRC
ncbi:MAG: hypothetical protein IT257_07125 [Chitinophagaceae bacterium]|nr:hypothetical protein [Chitinophagaceae bacterium]